MAGSLVVLAAFVAGHGLSWVGGPRPWWGELVVIGRGVATIALVSFGLSALLGRHWRWALVHLGAVGVAVAPAAGRAKPTASGGADLTVVTLNAGSEQFSLDAAEGLRAWADRAGASVVALQEHPVTYSMDRQGFTSASTLAPIVRGGVYRALPPGRFVEAAPGSGDRGIAHVDNPVYASVPWVHQSIHRLPSPAPAAEHSPYTRAVLEWEGLEVAVYNVHLSSFTPERPWRRSGDVLAPRAWVRFFRAVRRDLAIRAAEAEALRGVLDGEPRPYLVLGDLNSAPGQRVHDLIVDGRTDAFATKGWGPGFTYHARVPFVRIDYVLASPEWEVVSSGVLDGVASDHRAVWASLRLRSRSTPRAPERGAPSATSGPTSGPGAVPEPALF